MSSSGYSVRRATLEDIGPLMELWRTMSFPVEDLAKRVTEFQVACDPFGGLVGATGLHVEGREGLIHSEAFVDFSLAEAVRPKTWERLNLVATNTGLVRLWTLETAPFWHQAGMSSPSEQSLQKLPAAWKTANGKWLCLKLREDLDNLVCAEKEFTAFMELERHKSARLQQRAQTFKFVVTLVGLGLFVAAVIFAAMLLLRNPHLLRR
jgi:N-acetylglutamate synthase-like GNAT family acetyltransferase